MSLYAHVRARIGVPIGGLAATNAPTGGTLVIDRLVG